MVLLYKSGSFHQQNQKTAYKKLIISLKNFFIAYGGGICEEIDEAVFAARSLCDAGDGGKRLLRRQSP